MKSIKLKIIAIIGIVLGTTIVSCDDKGDKILEENIYKVEVSVKGDIEGYYINFGIYNVANQPIYDKHMNTLVSPYNLSLEDLQKNVNIFYFKLYGKKMHHLYVEEQLINLQRTIPHKTLYN